MKPFGRDVKLQTSVHRSPAESVILPGRNQKKVDAFLLLKKNEEIKERENVVARNRKMV